MHRLWAGLPVILDPSCNKSQSPRREVSQSTLTFKYGHLRIQKNRTTERCNVSVFKSLICTNIQKLVNENFHSWQGYLLLFLAQSNVCIMNVMCTVGVFLKRTQKPSTRIKSRPLFYLFTSSDFPEPFFLSTHAAKGHKQGGAVA